VVEAVITTKLELQAAQVEVGIFLALEMVALELMVKVILVVMVLPVLTTLAVVVEGRVLSA
jgi:hypothetical protein